VKLTGQNTDPLAHPEKHEPGQALGDALPRRETHRAPGGADAGPGGATAGARRWQPRQRVFAPASAYPLAGLRSALLDRSSMSGGGWRARSVPLSCPGALP